MKVTKRTIVKSFLAIGLALGLGAYSGAALAGESGHSHSHWSYEGSTGPAHWGHMSKDYSACLGQNQSPIDIKASQKEDLADIEFNYKPGKLHVVNNGHTVQFNYDEGSSIKVNGSEYKLVQFHFHTPSEHTINGKHFPMELHLVHKNDKNELAVVGVILEKGKENAAYKKMWSHLPKKADEKKDADLDINAAELLPKSRQFYSYPGSLTTPPCSEGVTWLVLKTPVNMSAQHIKQIKDIMKNNSRPVQPVNARVLKEDTASK